MINNKTIQELMQDSGVGFGTSGARGLVSQMTDEICYAYTLGFIQHLQQTKYLPEIKTIAIAGDLRPSTQRIMNACAKAILDANIEVINSGTLASPAIALFGIEESMATIMVTGSHIPDDRNGIKFNTAYGEILKSDEESIRQQRVSVDANLCDTAGAFKQQNSFLGEVSLVANKRYIARFINFFPKQALSDMKVGVYQHSGVARDVIVDVLTQLGAQVIPLAPSEIFIPVDTEAIRPEDVVLAKGWVKQHNLDAIVSTDGDADRPLISDELGSWFSGDIVGVLCAIYLNVEHIVTPVSSNTLVEKSKYFEQVYRSRIGSPYVIEQMQNSLAKGEQRVAGYEANGGFLSADQLSANGQVLSALPTRDALIVIISLLHLSQNKHCKMSELCDDMPKRFTHSDRIKEIPTEKSHQLLSSYIADKTHQAFVKDFISVIGEENKIIEVNTLDGYRVTLNNDDIIHLRPSGNAPEFRCYIESSNLDKAVELNLACLSLIKKKLSSN